MTTKRPTTTADEVIAGTVVIGLGGDDDSDARLLGWARAVTDGDCPLVLLHAIDPTLVALLPGDDARDVFEGYALAHLDSIAASDPRCERLVAFDHRLTALAEASQHASMLVVGSHRSSRMSGFVTGSIAQHLPAISACPVAMFPLA